MKKLALVLVALMLVMSVVGCGSKKATVSGRYNLTGMVEDGTDYSDMLDELGECYLEFEDGNVTMVLLGSEMTGTYEVNGSTCAITIDGSTVDFTIKGDTITGEEDGESMTFTKE